MGFTPKQARAEAQQWANDSDAPKFVIHTEARRYSVSNDPTEARQALYIIYPAHWSAKRCSDWTTQFAA